MSDNVNDTSAWFCFNCHKELVMQRTDFSYLGHIFHAETLRCPECGMVFINKELAQGKMAETEATMEDK